MKHVLITGGAGFAGSHLVEHILKTTDWEICIMDRLTYAGNLNRLTQIDVWEQERKRVQFVYHDFRSPIVGVVANSIFRDTYLDYIIHNGAETHVDNSLRDAMPFATSNVVGTLNMLEYARTRAIDKFYYVSTDEVYGATDGKYLHKEGEAHKPSNPYAASKSGAEAFCRAYHRTHGVPVIISNTMNMFGERQEHEKFIPKVIRAVYEGKPVAIHCKIVNGEIVDISSRCWLHARNQADGILFLLDNGKAGEGYNVVGEWASVETIAVMIGKILGKDVSRNYVDFHSTRPGHDLHYGLDGQKIRNMGWEQPLNLEASLRKTIEWTLENRSWL